MIYDDIVNISKYPQIDMKVAEFVGGLTPNNPLGRVYLSDDGLTYANIDEYTTKKHPDCRLEAHKKYIDIQLLLEGVEELDYVGVEGLAVCEEYDAARDVMFFSPCEHVLNKVVLRPGKFVLLYPHEAHQPQMAYKNEPSYVKKVVIKIPVG